MSTFARVGGGNSGVLVVTIGSELFPATYTPLRDEVLARLRQALIGGGFTAGERIRETDLSTRLGVSRGTLREALRQLEQEGLVVTAPHRGTTVVNPSLDEIRDIYGLRVALEGYAVEQAATLITADELEALQAVVDDLNALAATGRIQFAPRLGLDLHFHELLCEATRNPRLLRTWTELCGPLRLLFSSIHEPFLDSVEVIDQHQQVVDALRAGDADAARLILREHLTSSRDHMLETLRARDADADAKPAALRP